MHTGGGLRVENQSIRAWIQTNTANRRDWILLLGSQGSDGLKRCRVRNLFIRRSAANSEQREMGRKAQRRHCDKQHLVLTQHSRSTAVFHIHSFISVRQLQ